MWSCLINLWQDMLLYLHHRGEEKGQRWNLALPKNMQPVSGRAGQRVSSESHAFASNLISRCKNWSTLSKHSLKVSVGVCLLGSISIRENDWIKMQSPCLRGEYPTMKHIRTEVMSQETHSKASQLSFAVLWVGLWWTVCKYEIRGCVIGGSMLSPPGSGEQVSPVAEERHLRGRSLESMWTASFIPAVGHQVPGCCLCQFWLRDLCNEGKGI